MTRPTFLKLLAIATLVPLAASPTSVLAAKQQKTEFQIVLKGVARYDPINIAYFEYGFRARGAINDSGTMGGSGQYRIELVGKKATYLIVFDPGASTFEIWLSGTLLGACMYTYEISFSNWWVRELWDFKGTLVGD